jgi:hypothetical protein
MHRRPLTPLDRARRPLSEGLLASDPVVGFDVSFHRSDLLSFRRLAIAQLAAISTGYEVCDLESET